MPRFIEHIEDGKNVVVSFPDGQIDISADGIGPALIGVPNTKISFYQSRQAGPNEPTQREIVATIQIPTATILAFADQIRATLKDNGDAVNSALEQMKALID
jgi:hypothetical protein